MQNQLTSRLNAAMAGALVMRMLAACGDDDPAPAATPQGIARVVIDTAKSEDVTFGGVSFGSVGTYQKIRGVAYGQLDPNDPKNQVIADIALADKNPLTGMVEYSTEFFILKPTDLLTPTEN